jgi:hypothetical protein
MYKLHCKAGLPDGLFLKQKIPIWLILNSLAMEVVSIFCGHLYIVCPFGIFYGESIYFSTVLVRFTKKNLAVLLQRCSCGSWLMKYLQSCGQALFQDTLFSCIAKEDESVRFQQKCNFLSTPFQTCWIILID